jgi:hypothetical protein
MSSGTNYRRFCVSPEEALAKSRLQCHTEDGTWKLSPVFFTPGLGVKFGWLQFASGPKTWTRHLSNARQERLSLQATWSVPTWYVYFYSCEWNIYANRIWKKRKATAVAWTGEDEPLFPLHYTLTTKYSLRLRNRGLWRSRAWVHLYPTKLWVWGAVSPQLMFGCNGMHLYWHVL